MVNMGYSVTYLKPCFAILEKDKQSINIRCNAMQRPAQQAATLPDNSIELRETTLTGD